MFGYQETDFTVQKTFELHLDGSRQKMEVRVEVPDPEADAFLASLPESLRKNTRPRDLDRYIALEGYNADGKLDMDVLLLYSAGAEAQLEADWDRLVTDAQVRIDELTGWYQKVYSHGTGYYRSGGVVMY